MCSQNAAVCSPSDRLSRPPLAFSRGAEAAGGGVSEVPKASTLPLTGAPCHTHTFRRYTFPWCNRPLFSTHCPSSCNAGLTADELFSTRARWCKRKAHSHGELITLAWDGSTKMGVIVLNDPAHFNALGGSLIIDLTAVVEHANTMACVKGLVLQAAGPHFCIGGNPYGKHVGVASMAAFADSLLMTTHGCCKLRELTCPLTVAVHGHLAGGGIALCLNASCRVADLRTTFEHGNLPRGACEHLSASNGVRMCI
jgi:hypothetical protein